MTLPYGLPRNRMSLEERIRINGSKGSATSSRRKAPNKTTKERILAAQKGRCLYCEMPLGSEVLRNGRPVSLRLNWDHFIPYSYLVTNPNDNWVAACHVCNSIKGPRLFDTIAEAQRYIMNRAIQKGYVYPRVR